MPWCYSVLQKDHVDAYQWMSYFNEQKAKAQALQAQIDRTDKEIDRLVYALYGLTEEEVAAEEGRKVEI